MCRIANRMLGLISRTIRYRHPTYSFAQSLQISCQTTSGLLLICVEPILHQGHRTARASPTSLHSIVFGISKLVIYDDRLRQLGLWSLQERRNEVISLSFSNWLKVSLVLHGMNSSTGLRTLSPEVTAGNC